MLKRIFLVFNLIFILGCQNKNNDPEVPVISIPQLVSLTGSSIQISTSDVPRLIESPIIVTDDGTPIPDGTQFNLVADVVKINNVDAVNSINWSSSMTVTSKDGKFSFYVKPHTIAGLYRVNAYPVANPNIKFDQGLSARYFVNVVAGIPTSLGTVKTEIFEDKAPYNNLKDANEDWIVSANPDLVSYISVGPITDSFNNLVEDGEIELSVTSGSILSENPSRIISGYAYFSYKADGIISSVNASATIIRHPLNPVLTQISVIKKSAPQIELRTIPDFTAMTVGSTKCETFDVVNNGSMTSTYLTVNSTFPFHLLDENTSDPLCPITIETCRVNQSLRSGESCKLRVKFTMPNSSVSDGELSVQVNPQEFASSLLIQKLRTQSVQAAQLVASNPFISFGGTQCSTTRTVDITVENIGDFDATGLVVQNPPPNTNQSNPFYTLILPPADVPMNPSLGAVVNCGTTFPAKRKCRVQVQFNPTAGILNQALLGKILGTNINPLIISVSGYTVPGNGLNTFPINFITPNNSILPLGMLISNSQQSRIDVGPIVDACNQRVADGSILTASVSAGSLLQSTLVSNNGFVSFYWNAGNDISKIGTQTATISVGVNGSKNGSLVFKGINLQLSGNSDFQQVISGKPKELIVTLSNIGNIDAQNLSFNISQPLIVVDAGTCSSGQLNAGSSCQLKIKADPQGQNQDYTIPLSVSSVNLGNNSATLNFNLQARTKAILSFDQNDYLFNDGTNSSVFRKDITLTNNGPAISYDTVINVEAPFFVDSSNCSSTLNVNQSCLITVGLNQSDVSLAVDKKIKVSNEIDVESPFAILGFSIFEFNQQPILGIVGRCSGPYSVSIKGSTGTITSASSQTINLTSAGGVLFYPNSSCTTGSEITSIGLTGGSSISNSFYLSSSILGQNQIIASNASISSGVLGAQFNAELSLNIPSPNALVDNENLLLIPLGGFGTYSVSFVGGGLTSTYADIIDQTALDENGDLSPTGNKIISVKPITGGKQSVVIRITDVQNFSKDFTFDLYPVISTTGSITIQNTNANLIPFNSYLNPNTLSFKIQNLSGSNYVDGSLYGSTIDSTGYYTAGASMSSGTEYVLIEVPKATGGNSFVRVSVTVNLQWPFGTLGDLIINSGQTVNLSAGQSYDYRSITINSGGTLNISGMGIIVLGSVNNVVINGSITSSVIDPDTCAQNPYPFSVANPDTNIPTPITTSITQNVGGSGGVGGGGVYYSQRYGGAGGSGACGYGGGGGGGSSTDNGLPGGSGGGSGGTGNYNGYIGYGGQGMSTYGAGANAGTGSSSSLGGFVNVGGAGGGSGGAGPSLWGAAGGGGGMRGYHKNSLYIKTKSSIFGNGTINLAGTNGFKGGNGGSAACSGGGGQWGNGGAGGGGAGGSGGNVFFYYKNSRSTTISLNLQGGAGGLGGSGIPLCDSARASGSGGSGSSGNSGSFSYSLW